MKDDSFEQNYIEKVTFQQTKAIVLDYQYLNSFDLYSAIWENVIQRNIQCHYT